MKPKRFNFNQLTPKLETLDFEGFKNLLLELKKEIYDDDFDSFIMGLIRVKVITQYLKKFTSFLDECYPKGVDNAFRIKIVLEGVDCVEKIPKCNCGKVRTVNKNPHLIKTGIFALTCGNRSCMQSHPETIEKKHETARKNYGSLKAAHIDTMNETIQEKYGVDNVSRLNSIKQKKIETSLKNWGTEYPWQSEEGKRLQVAGVRKKYGVDNVSKLITIYRKKLETLNNTFTSPYGEEILFEGDEKKILDLLFDKYHTDIEIHPSFSIEYEENKIWFPDASLKSSKTLIELKSFFNQEHSIKLIKKFLGGIDQGFRCLCYFLYQDRVFETEIIDVKKLIWSINFVKRVKSFNRAEPIYISEYEEKLMFKNYFSHFGLNFKIEPEILTF